MVKKKKLLLLIIVIAILIIASVVTAMFYLNSYTTYKDQNIQVEVPYGTEFDIKEQVDSNVEYKSKNGIEISILTPTSDSLYNTLKETNLTNNTLRKALNTTKYNGDIYTLGNGSDTRYQIYLEFDDMKMIVAITAKDLNTVIHIANTFKILKQFNVSFFEENTTENETTTKTNSPSNHSSVDTQEEDTVIYEGVEYGSDDVKPYGYYENERIDESWYYES